MRRDKQPTDEELVPGCLVMMDLDRFREATLKRGWHPYKPNIVTGRLTREVESLLVDFRGVVIYGLDYERGTEEAVLEFPLRSCREIERRLENIRRNIEATGESVTIVCVEGMVSGRKSSSRKDAYHGTPWRRMAHSLLRRMKRKGGNIVVCY